jgi:hypothetical protein
MMRMATFILTRPDGLAVKTNVAHPVYNEVKVYLDAYPQQSTPGGDRYPASTAI